MAHRVQLAVSPLGGLPGVAQAWHSSVLVGGEEFSFSDAGISVSQGTPSHAGMKSQAPSSQGPFIIDMGTSAHSGRNLFAVLEKHFLPDTYDLLRKNCNSFSDLALFYLVQKRLDSKYRSLEQLGAGSLGMVQAASGGQYTPNPRTAGFDQEKLIEELDPGKVWRTPGHTTGGARRAPSVEAVRGARLARFAGISEISNVRSKDRDGYAQQSRQDPSDCSSAPEVASASQQLRQQLLGDEELARRLAAEEQTGSAQTPAPAGGPDAQASDEEFARRLSDEELAARLQAEENDSGRGRGGSTPGNRRPRLARANEMPETLSQALGVGREVMGGAGQFLNCFVQEISHEMNRAANTGPRDGGRANTGTPNYAPNPRHASGSPFVAAEGAAAGPPHQGQADVFNRSLPPELLQPARRAAADAQRAAAEGFVMFENLLNEALTPQGGPSRGGVAAETLHERTVTVTANANGAAGNEGEGTSTQAQAQCMICFDGFAAGQELRILPCMHRYHKVCIDPWLRQSSLCPICKHDLRS